MVQSTVGDAGMGKNAGKKKSIGNHLYADFYFPGPESASIVSVRIRRSQIVNGSISDWIFRCRSAGILSASFFRAVEMLAFYILVRFRRLDTPVRRER